MSMNENMPLPPEQLRKLQMVLLDMLTEVDRICRKHDIKYTLIGGTLLGAVRHKGFIPWDDDADVSMLRGEYEKFKIVCQEELDHTKFFLQDHTTDPDYRWGYAKLRRKDSELIRAGQEHMKMQTGIFVDIFIVDNVPGFYPLRLVHASYCFVLRKILYSQVGAVTGKTFSSRVIYRLLNKIPTKFVFKRLDRLAEFWNKRQTGLVRTLTFPKPKGGKFGSPAKWIANIVDIEFEGRTLRAIQAYDEHLRYKYGEYMTLPPEDNRQWHPASVLRLPDEYCDGLE